MIDADVDATKRLSLGKVAIYCGVTRKTILRWVQEGLLKSFTLPSGHHRILPNELVRFLSDHKMPIPAELGVAPKKSVLIVDDEANIRRLIGDLLKPHFNIKEATSGIEACMAMGANPPDLLILDNRMPGMDGADVCRHARKDSTLQKMKIIIVSAHLDAETQAKLAGLADAFLHKPFSPPQLVKTCLSIAGVVPA